MKKSNKCKINKTNIAEVWTSKEKSMKVKRCNFKNKNLKTGHLLITTQSKKLIESNKRDNKN